MGSAYCWLNTNRTFAMVLTFKLQRRCGATKKYNAALYFAQLPGKQSGHGGAEPGDQRDDSDLVAVVHLLNDVFSGWTQELTAQYAYKSSVLTWFVLAIWSVLVPVQHAAHIHRECSIDAVDTALTCRNGVLEIGRFDRACALFFVACAIPLVDNRGNGGGHYVRR
ncbi:hypothetical protein B5M09_004300 [Aphanomyces astaci]|uniref:Uncharacterized protein n=1 Tax=Aphanomyces astaci TaxID=112090 RepID=A0A3R8D3Z6_APHAT|nr:hypothetical protein B5M09_004300 [Aphanomyces astaci]